MPDFSDQELICKIQAIKEKLGKKLVILAHHYQRKEIVDLGDYKGDSFGLSKTAAENSAAHYIVFCGVHFMAESAAILAQPHQIVQMPDAAAGCWMAEMADIYQVEKAWSEIMSTAEGLSMRPIVYMNSDAEIKAFCGRHKGTVCTSSNAQKALEWAFKESDKVFFFPDQHLGRNTGNQMGIPSEEMIVWDPNRPLGGNTPSSIKKAKIILWDAYCLVHTRFLVEHMERARKNYPDAKIVVHPECTQEVVNLADAVGSTSFIVKYVEDAPKGATIIIGTEVNLIQRLAAEYPDKKIHELDYSLCPNMYKINLENLLWTLENLAKVNIVTVSEDIKKDAQSALDQMLDL